MEVGHEDVHPVGGRERAGELGVKRAAPRESDDLGEAARPRLAAPRHGFGWTAHGHGTLRPGADGADTQDVRLVAFLLVPFVLFSGWQILRRERTERGLALVASQVAQREVGVSCPGFWTRLVEITPNAGWVGFDENGRPADKTQLSAQTCSSLERLRRHGPPAVACLFDHRLACPRSTLEIVEGMLVLAHESWHLRGVLNEARTQCYAVQTLESVARSFGFAPAEAALVAASVAIEDARTLLGEYHSPECRPGGAYDLHPDTPAWPMG